MVPAAIPQQEIRRDRASYVDPHGYLFHRDGDAHLYRLITSQRAEWYRELFRRGIIWKLSESGHLVDSEPLDIAVEGEPGAFVVRHRRIWPVSYCVEWPPSMLHAAALATLDLALEVLPYDLMLQDAYPWNILFDGICPVFVDLTSLVPLERQTIWPALDQFEAFFLRPLWLAYYGRAEITRRLLFDHLQGVSRAQWLRWLPLRFFLFHPLAPGLAWMERKLQHSAVWKERIRRWSEGQCRKLPMSARITFMKRLRSRTESLRPRPSKGDVWKDYYEHIPPQVQKEAKLTAVRTALERLGPRTVLDLGCNTGVFSIVAAQLGAQVVSIDSSEACVETLYQAAVCHSWRITPLVADVCCPTPAFGFMADQFPQLWQRVSADVVLCLGLMHHLMLTGRQPLERVVDLLHATSRVAAVLEYIGLDDDNIGHLPERRQVRYDLESVVGALWRRFSKVEVVDSDRPTRKLLIGTK